MPIECTSCAESMSLPTEGAADGADAAPVCARCRASERGEAPLVLRVRGLRHTVELLRLGGAIEELTGVAVLSLVRGEPGDAWFAATPLAGGTRLERAHALADALERIPGYRSTALATEMGVELDTSPLAEEAPPAPTPTTPPEPAAAATEPLAEPPTPNAEVRVPPPDAVTPEERPGGAALLSEHLTLVVAPFHSFARLNEFRAALHALPGVRSARVRRFYRGSLQLAVDYDDPAPLPTRLAELAGFRWRLASEGDDRVEIELDEASPGDAAPTRAAG